MTNYKDWKNMSGEQVVLEYAKLLVSKAIIEDNIANLWQFVSGENGDWLVDVDGVKFCLRISAGNDEEFFKLDETK